MRPDLQQFNEHYNSAEFQTGVDKGQWGVLDYNPERPTWPFVYIWVEAGNSSAGKYMFRFNLSNYPSSAPTACFWDTEKDSHLPKANKPVGNQRANSVFLSDFKNGECLYCPFDRLAQEGHDTWKQQHPDLWWKPTFTIVKYLDFIHELLN